MKPTQLTSTLFFLGILVVFNSNCSMIGLGIGAAVDNANSKYTPVENFRDILSESPEIPDTVLLRKGQSIFVKTFDAKEISGRFRRVQLKNNELCIEISGREARKTYVPLDQVQEVHLVHSPGGGKAVGFLVGAAIDVGILVAISSIDMNMGLGSMDFGSAWRWY